VPGAWYRVLREPWVLLLLTGRIGVKRTGLPAKIRGAQKNAKDRPLQNRETLRQFNFFWKQNGSRRRAPCFADRAASRNGFVSKDGHQKMAATMPREINRSSFGRQAPV
jgi:hypothetical protein